MSTPRRPSARHLAAALSVALAAAPVFAQPPAPAPPAAAALVASTPKAVQTYRSHIEFLANPFMEGRGPGTRGNLIASEYIESCFQSLSLLPAFALTNPGPDRSTLDNHLALQTSPELSRQQVGQPAPEWRQPFNAGTNARRVRSALSNDTCQAKNMAFLTPFSHTALGFSATAHVNAPLAFVGYGIQKGGPDGSYNTFAESDDLSGKIAVLLRFEPLDAAGNSRWRKPTDTTWSVAAALPQKIQEVVKRKAPGLIIIMPPGVNDPRAAKDEATETTGRWHSPIDIPAIMMSATEGERLMTNAGAPSLMDLRKLADASGGVKPLGDCRFDLDVQIDRSPRTTWNIAATLPGRGELASQYIIIGAHYDHVGYGYTGGSRSDEYGIVHPGADDNASGASGLLLAAEMLKRNYQAEDARLGEPGHPRRSIMFIAFSAEEMGLIGSREFMKASPLEAKQIDAMLNMDMIGRLRDNRLEVSGTGTAEGFADLLKPLFDSSGLSIAQSPGGRGPSDHATFYGAGIPVLHFFTGQHEQYHTPRDTADLINSEGAVKVVDLVCSIASTLATHPEQLVFTSTDKKGAKPDEPAGPTLGGLKVRFGIAPANYADGEAGVLVGEVYPGTCAAEAGILPQDRLIRWNAREIGDVAGWMTFLAQHKPGDTVDVDVKRKGEEVRVRVTLKSRDQSPK